MRPRTKGLVGLFGHTYTPDDENPDPNGQLVIQYQFKVVRELKGDRYLVQYFSWWDGSPSNVAAMTETELLGPTVKLYPTEEDWKYACEKEGEKQRAMRKAHEHNPAHRTHCTPL